MGEYAPPFLAFIESAANTASQTGWLTSFRGTSHWVAYFPGGGSAGWVGGWELASSAVLLVTTVAVAGVGLLGLLEPGLWARRVLVATMLVGLAVLTVGSPEPAGSVLGRDWLEALDSWLAPLRNVHKFDPLIRLPISLGMGAFVATAVPRLVARARRLSSASRRRTGALVVTLSLALLVGAAAQPAASGELRDADGAVAISSSWQQAAQFLREQEGHVGVLVLPGTIFSVQTWGRTIDEPIQVLSAPPWASRSQSAIAPAGTLRVLDAIENQVAAGHPIDGFASSLRRLGITHVVVRNDLDPTQTNAPPVPVVMSSVRGSTGLTPVADFGTHGRRLPGDRGPLAGGRRPGPPCLARRLGPPRGRPGWARDRQRPRPGRSDLRRRAGAARRCPRQCRSGSAGRRRHRQQPARRAVLRAHHRRGVGRDDARRRVPVGTSRARLRRRLGAGGHHGRRVRARCVGHGVVVGRVRRHPRPDPPAPAPVRRLRRIGVHELDDGAAHLPDRSVDRGGLRRAHEARARQPPLRQQPGRRRVPRAPDHRCRLSRRGRRDRRDRGLDRASRRRDQNAPGHRAGGARRPPAGAAGERRDRRTRDPAHPAGPGRRHGRDVDVLPQRGDPARLRRRRHPRRVCRDLAAPDTGDPGLRPGRRRDREWGVADRRARRRHERRRPRASLRAAVAALGPRRGHLDVRR